MLTNQFLELTSSTFSTQTPHILEKNFHDFLLFVPFPCLLLRTSILECLGTPSEVSSEDVSVGT
jgi:hypothetical protein